MKVFKVLKLLTNQRLVKKIWMSKNSYEICSSLSRPGIQSQKLGDICGVANDNDVIKSNPFSRFLFLMKRNSLCFSFKLEVWENQT